VLGRCLDSRVDARHHRLVVDRRVQRVVGLVAYRADDLGTKWTVDSILCGFSNLDPVSGQILAFGKRAKRATRMCWIDEVHETRVRILYADQHQSSSSALKTK